MSSRLIIGALLALSCCASASAQVYQWRDAEGKLHFTDTPPPESQKVEERRLQVNSVEGLKPAEPNLEAEGQAQGETSPTEQLDPDQLQQKAQSQCAAVAQRMPTLLYEMDVVGREAVIDGRGTEADHKKMMDAMKEMHEGIERDKDLCVTSYVEDAGDRTVIDCIADSEDAVSFAVCSVLSR